jgi:hypothetical protein
MRVLRNIGCLGLLFTVTHLNGVEATKASTMAAVNQQIELLSGAVHQALLDQGATVDQMSESELRSSIAEHLASFLDNASDRIEMFPTKENMLLQLENKQHHHHHKKHHKGAKAQPSHHSLASASSKDIY